MSARKKGILSTSLLSLLGLAVLFLLLGFGNLIYGKYKLESYLDLFRTEISAETPQPLDETEADDVQEESEKFRAFLQLGENDLAQQRAEDRRRKIAVRLEFYELVVIGGKAFLAFSGILFLVFLLIAKTRAGQQFDRASAKEVLCHIPI